MKNLLIIVFYKIDNKKFEEKLKVHKTLIVMLFDFCSLSMPYIVVCLCNFSMPHNVVSFYNFWTLQSWKVVFGVLKTRRKEETTMR
jgi:hypothetical protein